MFNSEKYNLNPKRWTVPGIKQEAGTGTGTEEEDFTITHKNIGTNIFYSYHSSLAEYMHTSQQYSNE